MKKLVIIASLLFGLFGASFAQTTPAPAKKPKTEKTTATSSTTAGPTKKDGTPDKRYKANKGSGTATVTTHVKKDGTPDKRFKENKKKP